MKNLNPQKSAAISWGIIGMGIVLALIGAATVQDYKINLLLGLGGLIVVGGIVWHLVMVRCPYCGKSLAGYRPLPKECPNCFKQF